MINMLFIGGLGLGLIAVLAWGVRTLPAEGWQMIAAVPVSKKTDGLWNGLNLTYYGFFMASASAFGVALVIVLLASVGTPLIAAAAVIITMIIMSVPASKIVASVIEGKRNTFTIAGAAFLASLVLPPGLLLAQWGLAKWFDLRLSVMPTLAAAAIAYALSEAIGRMACLSFGCCYGKPLREVDPRLARVFGKFPLVFQGSTKKAAYASGLAEEPLVPVQTITAIVFSTAGLVGLGLFLAGWFRPAALVPALVTWGWRAISELLRADHRGHSKVSIYQVMAMIAMAYLTVMISVLPGGGPTPDLKAGLAQIASAAVILGLQGLWIFLFLFYGRSRVTGSVVSFHVVGDRI